MFFAGTGGSQVVRLHAVQSESENSLTSVYFIAERVGLSFGFSLGSGLASISSKHFVMNLVVVDA